MIARARLRYLGTSAQKTRLVVDQVRGKNVEDALSILHFSRKLVARDVEKLVKSAVANAQVKDPKVAATFNIGGPICASVCTVLKQAA